ncbi:hypothetical protein Tco_0070671 [Tanacetum coccineum]
MGFIDCFQEEPGTTKDPLFRSFDDFKWVFDLEIDQLADEYELGIGKKGHILDDIWEYCKIVQRDNTNWWHDYRYEEDERQESGLDIEEYDPPKVHVENFKVKIYSFTSGSSFICVTKEVEDTLPLGREKRVKVHRNDLEGIRHRMEGPKEDIKQVLTARKRDSRYGITLSLVTP